MPSHDSTNLPATRPEIVVAGVTIFQDKHGRYNLNVLHVASEHAKNPSKAPNKWIRLPETKSLILELESQATHVSLDAAVGRHSVLEVVYGGNRNGTYAHELLAISYAGWISPSFQLKVNQAFIDSRNPRTQEINADRIIAAFLGKPRFEAKRFTVDFYAKVSRVYNKRIPTDHRHSKMMGGFLERYIYKLLPTMVRKQMDVINPRVNGNRKFPLHQMLTAEMDTEFLRERMRIVGDFLDGCRAGDWRTFRYLINNYDKRHCMQIEIDGYERMLLPVFEEAQLVMFEEKNVRKAAGLIVGTES